jgi:hypothetical protein
VFEFVRTQMQPVGIMVVIAVQIIVRNVGR